MSMVMMRSAISVISCIRFVIVELVGDGGELGSSVMSGPKPNFFERIKKGSRPVKACCMSDN